MQSFSLSSDFPFPADMVFEDALDYRRLADIERDRGLALHLPQRTAREGDRLVFPYRSLGLKLFDYRIEVTRLDRRERVLTSEEAGGPISSWRHRITVTPITTQSCRYTDRLSIQAGPLTPWVALNARRMYKRRQARRAETMRQP